RPLLRREAPPGRRGPVEDRVPERGHEFLPLTLCKRLGPNVAEGDVMSRRRQRRAGLAAGIAAGDSIDDHPGPSPAMPLLGTAAVGPAATRAESRRGTCLVLAT